MDFSRHKSNWGSQGIGRNTLWNWVKRYNAKEEPGLRRKPGQGRKRTLTPEKVEQIKEWVRKGVGIWTLNRIRLKLESEEDISVRRDSQSTKTQQAIWYRLRKSGWSWKTGRPTNPEGDKAEDSQQDIQFPSGTGGGSGGSDKRILSGFRQNSETMWILMDHPADPARQECSSKLLKWYYQP